MGWAVVLYLPPSPRSQIKFLKFGLFDLKSSETKISPQNTGNAISGNPDFVISPWILLDCVGPLEVEVPWALATEPPPFRPTFYTLIRTVYEIQDNGNFL